MIKSLYVHTCDECGKTFTEESVGKWINGWFQIKTSTPSPYSYINPSPVDICSPECMISWAQKQKQKKE
jgi:hypothetical protein